MTLPIADHITGVTLGELRRLARDLIALADALWGIGQRRADRHAAKDLYGIAFTPGGMLDLLQKIRDGEATQEIIDALEKLLEASNVRVNQQLRRVRKYSDIFRERYGFDAAMVLDRQIERKLSLRRHIGLIIAAYRNGEPDFEYMAARAVQEVESLNSILSKAHDRVLSSEVKDREKYPTEVAREKPNRRITKPKILPSAPDDLENLCSKRSQLPKKTS